MAKIEKIPAGRELDALVASKVMGWKRVHREPAANGGKSDRFRGKKPDKLGRWRSADVRHYSTDARDAYLIDQRMDELGLTAKYAKELSKITHAQGIPVQWASPEQRSRAALRTMNRLHRSQPAKRRGERRPA